MRRVVGLARLCRVARCETIRLIFVGWAVALFAVNIAFGLARLYQGEAGAMQTSVQGVLLDLLCLFRPSLLRPTAAHFTANMIVLAATDLGTYRGVGGSHGYVLRISQFGAVLPDLHRGPDRQCTSDPAIDNVVAAPAFTALSCRLQISVYAARCTAQGHVIVSADAN